MDDTNKVATGRCLYYDWSNSAQRLDATANDGVTNQTIAGSIRLGLWDTTAGGNNTSASWYEGNIQTCATKGMRLPTLYETTAADPGGSYKPTDVTPTFSSSTNGVPPAGSNTWTASASTNSNNHYWTWNSSSSQSTYYYTTTLAVRCVVP